MNLHNFPDANIKFAEHQPEYQPLPAFKFAHDPTGRIACCWRLTWRERLRVLFGAPIWHIILTFNQPLQPQLLQLNQPFTPDDIAAAKAEKKAQAEQRAFETELLTKYGHKAREKMKHYDALNYHPNDRRRTIQVSAEDYQRCKTRGTLFIEGARIVNDHHQSPV